MQGRPSAPPKQWQRVSSMRPTTGGAWVHAPPQETQVSRRVSHHFLTSSPPHRRWPAKYQKKHNRQTVLIFFHGFFGSASLFSFRSASLQINSSMGFLSPLPLWIASRRRKDGCWSAGVAVFGSPLEAIGSAGTAGGRRHAGCRLQKMKKSVAPALPCVGCWLTCADDAAAVGSENRSREM